MHLGHGGGQERQTRAVQPEECVARRGSVEDDMRMLTASFTRALQRQTGRVYMCFLSILQEVKPMSKTRNQFVHCISPAAFTVHSADEYRREWGDRQAEVRTTVGRVISGRKASSNILTIRHHASRRAVAAWWKP